jgi:phospholipase/carboxylesterase
LVEISMVEDIVIQMPDGAPGQLFLLFHGVGSNAQAMAALGRRLGEAFPSAAVISVSAPGVSDLGTGYQWFSVQGVTEGNRAERIAAVLPLFVSTVRGLQSAYGVSAAQTALVGFSQGAIMALGAAAQVSSGEGLAGRVVSLAGRLAGVPLFLSAETTVHLLHGERDSVISCDYSVAAAEGFSDLGGDVTVDILAGVGHSVADEMGEVLVERLLSYIPKRVWDQAVSGG